MEGKLLWQNKASYLISTGSSLPGVKLQERGAHHAPSSSAEDKNVWNSTDNPSFIFMVWHLDMGHLHL